MGARQKLLIYTSAYKAPWWEHSVASLRWPRNLEVVRNARFLVWTNDPDRARTIYDGLDYELADARQEEALRISLRRAFEENAMFLFAAPDMIFGDGSIANLIEICNLAPARAIAAGHIRVVPELCDELNRPLTNAELVSAAFRHLHPAFRESEAKEMNNTYDVGTSWREISDGLYVVTFHIPTVHLLAPNGDDVAYWDNPGLNRWDHEYPVMLIENGKHKLVGSSDAAFMVEITKETLHWKSVRRASHDGYDVYRNGNRLNCRFNANSAVILRAA